MSSINQFKIIFLGDAGVGKSSLIHRYNSQSFLQKPEATLGTAFFCKVIVQEGKVIKLNIWDTSGEEKYRAMTPMYYKDADVAILTYDIADLKTLDGVEYYLEELKENAPENMSNDLNYPKSHLYSPKLVILTLTIVIMIAGNKCDLLKTTSSKEIEEIEQLARVSVSKNSKLSSVSAKSQLHINLNLGAQSHFFQSICLFRFRSGANVQQSSGYTTGEEQDQNAFTRIEELVFDSEKGAKKGKAGKNGRKKKKCC